MFLLPVLAGYLYNHETVRTSAMIGGTLTISRTSCS